MQDVYYAFRGFGCNQPKQVTVPEPTRLQVHYSTVKGICSLTEAIPVALAVMVAV